MDQETDGGNPFNHLILENGILLTRDALIVRERERGAASINLRLKNRVYELVGGSPRVFKLGGVGT